MGTRKSRTERRADLIDAARRAMIAHGTDTVGLNQVAEQAGLTSGAVLYHYPHLPDLLIEAHHAGMERFYEARVRAAAAVSDPACRPMPMMPTCACSANSAARPAATGSTPRC